ncbi:MULTISPECIES: hypothetical protein [Actinoalloteichus]|uniref:Uncharacterized protein n=1 Tax=Actinoalloteichus fjordicus TaxID=1612552 RepID=A0AAC9LG32_9PSEU|nr:MULTISPECIES: hypothetical protein [Actinoalloteichus]APU16215.1 hypothetical protein UA74_20950 [Actinoalloteichus fjordicus]APU22275.1 hypothetical protein UA75_21430 [Actinoalloteichus sp. GBA129-24]
MTRVDLPSALQHTQNTATATARAAATEIISTLAPIAAGIDGPVSLVGTPTLRRYEQATGALAVLRTLCGDVATVGEVQ